MDTYEPKDAAEALDVSAGSDFRFDNGVVVCAKCGESCDFVSRFQGNPYFFCENPECENQVISTVIDVGARCENCWKPSEKTTEDGVHLCAECYSICPEDEPNTGDVPRPRGHGQESENKL